MFRYAMHWDKEEMEKYEVKTFSNLKGHTITKVQGGKVGDKEVVFTIEDESRYGLFHQQDCCESVSIADVAGDWEKILGEEVLLAEEVSLESGTNPPDYVPEVARRYDGSIGLDPYRDSFTWTFYKLRTMHGYVVLRWLGESNGYYGESVDFAPVIGEV